MKRTIIALCILPLLAGCGISDKMSKAVFGPSDKEVTELPPCPLTGVMPEADQIPVFYGAASKPTADDVAATGYLGKISGGCNFDKAGQAAMELHLSFMAKRGPKGVALRKQPLPYFIAVLSPDETVLQRKAFSTKVDFDNDTGTATEEHDVVVPVPTKEAAGSYKVVVGFQLTPEQAAFNQEDREKTNAVKN